MTETQTTETPAPAKTKTVKAEKAPRKGLRKPQVRILKYLAKQGKPQPRSVIAEKCGVDLASLSGYIGSHDDQKRAKDDERYMSLLSLKYLKFGPTEEGGPAVYEATANGRKIAMKLPNV